MSSRSSAAIKAERPSKPTPGRTKNPSSHISVDAMALATAIEQALAEGRNDLLTPEALQALMAAGCKAYAAQVEAGHDLLPFGKRNAVSATDVMTTASGLLRAVNLAVFELGMWQSWTGR